MSLLDILFGPPVPEVTVQEFATALREPGIQTIDVREYPEWKKEHIEGVQHMPLSHLKHYMNELSPDRPVLIICRSGHRSAIAARILLKAGFQEVYSVRGGMKTWAKAMLPVNRFAD